MDENIAPAPQAEATPVAPVVAEDSNPQPSPVAEPTTSESPAPEGQAEQAPINEPAPVEPQSEPERQPSRAERRIQQLTGQLKEFTQQSQATVPLPQLPTSTPRLSDLIAGRDTIDPSELDRLAEQQVQAVRGMNNLEVQQLRHELTQQRAVDEVEKEASILPTQYEELNPDSPKYNPVLEQKIEAAYKQRAVVTNPYNPSVKMVDPSVRLSDVAKDYIEVARAAAEQGKAQTNATLATIADTSAVTPTSDTPVEKSLEDMTLQEHEAYLKSKGYNI